MANDLWRTPKEVFDNLDKEFVFICDMCATHDSALHYENYYTEQEDSLSFRWEEVVSSDCIGLHDTVNYVWCNPPYSDPMPWVKKALEAQKDGLGVVMLLNNDPGNGWFAEALKGASEIRHIIGDEKPNGKYSSGRLAFLNEDGKPVNGNNKPQVIFVFNPFKIGANVTSYVKKSELMK